MTARVILLGLTLFAAGCAATGPERFPVGARDVGPFASNGPVALRNVSEPGPARAIKTFDREETKLDYFAYSTLLVDTLRDELSDRGVALSGSADRTIDIAVAHMNLVLTVVGLVCYVDFELKTSSGYVHGYLATGKSNRHYEACNAATAAGVAALLHDPVLRRFLEAG